MLATLTLVLAQAEEAAQPADEGRRIIIGMLIVGLIFVGVVVLGETYHYVRHLRRRRHT